ncbi:TonB-dependent receptor [Sphingopyxis sp. OPL5]|uniref:TonB-dependent receptor domain-containing protein n=1 Tax=Sphingopyxis sp. OPL5 TaxID=2486273 RepID=UPI00164DD0C5|nr:TonB-dependent receptor [Sphingopyxis sp. OPL5]QNO26796.1 TonB-dependent receptor [Sphingopyxis sp. OPL5]
MNRSLPFLVAAAALCAPTVASAAEERAFDVPKGSLATALPLVSRQGGVSISVADAQLWNGRVKAVRGRMSVDEAIRRMLAGTEARAIRVSATSWRIERRPSPPPKVARRATSPPKTPPSRAREPDNLVAGPGDEIIVTASKTDLPYASFAGVATVLDGGDLAFGGERGMESILSRMATVSSTHLGSGRNKLFIRGIADSSFTGPTQSTVGQYLGDIRLSYNAPDPDLRLYDIESVEILEGPQGTLYGAGSLGGIIRVVPQAPDPDRQTVQASAGVSLTQHGDPGGDLGATVNLPIGETGHALRLVGYMISDGGYIDNPLRGQKDVNRVNVRGGRATFRVDAGDDWTVDLGGVYQSIVSQDAQYADKNAPPLIRNSMVEQNAKAKYGLGTIVVMKDWDGLHFQSSNAFVSHRLFERFDASNPNDPPRILDQRNATRMFVSETRLSRPFDDGLGWVIGASILDNRTRQSRELGNALVQMPLTGVANRITEFTGYGEATVEVTPNLIAAGGLRLSHASLDGSGRDIPLDVAFAGRAETAHRSETDLLPSASLLALPVRNVTLYVRYQEGFRPGGLAVDNNFVRRFRNDQVQTLEAGVRFGEKGWTPFDASLSVSHSRWRDIQADFIDTNGFPTTANIGDGRITSITGAFAVRPTPGLSFELGAVYNHSRVTELFSGELRTIAVRAAAAGGDVGITIPQEALLARLGQIPNVARYAVRGSFNYAAPMGDEDLRINGWANYVGPSRLGIGPILGEGQGKYLDTGLAMRLGDHRRGLSLTLTNLFDAKGNRFALGTPFVEGSAGFLTPLRPRTIRIAIDVAY